MKNNENAENSFDRNETAPFFSHDSDAAKKAPRLSPSPLYPPLDGGWGWAIVLGSFLYHFCVVGISKSFGVLFLGFRQEFPAASTGVIYGFGAVAFGLVHTAAPLSACLARRGASDRWMVVGAGLMLSVGVVASAFVRNVETLYATFGLTVGLALGVAYNSVAVMIGAYFEERRAVASGIGVAGSGCGGMALPPLWTLLLGEYGLRGTLLIIGAVMLHVCLVGILFRPIEDNYPEDRRSLSAEMSVESAQSSATPPSGFKVAIGFLRNPKFAVYLLSSLFSTSTMVCSWTMLPPFAIERSLTKPEAALLISVNSCCDMICRLGCGFVLDKPTVKANRLFVLSAVVFLQGLADLILVGCVGFGSFVVYGVGYGILNSISVTLRFVALQDIMGRDDLPLLFGVFNFFLGFGNFGVALFGGVLVDAFDSHAAPFVFNGAAAVAASLAFLIPATLHRRGGKLKG